MVALIAAALLHKPAPAVLIVDSLPIGGVTGTTWGSFSDSEPTLPSKTVHEVGLTTPGKSRTVKGLVFQEGPGFWFVDFGPSGGEGVFMSGRKPMRKRPIEKLSPKNATYEKELAAFFAEHGKTHLKPVIRQILRADLDGDGTKEVLIEASSQTSPIVDSKPTDYSLVLLRQVVKGKVQTTVVSFDTISGEEGALYYHNRIRSIADLDGDGSMEVVVSSDYYEGQSAMVWKLKGGKFTKVSENGAGV